MVYRFAISFLLSVTLLESAISEKSTYKIGVIDGLVEDKIGALNVYVDFVKHAEKLDLDLLVLHKTNDSCVSPASTLKTESINPSNDLSNYEKTIMKLNSEAEIIVYSVSDKNDSLTLGEEKNMNFVHRLVFSESMVAFYEYIWFWVKILSFIVAVYVMEML